MCPIPVMAQRLTCLPANLKAGNQPFDVILWSTGREVRKIFFLKMHGVRTCLLLRDRYRILNWFYLYRCKCRHYKAFLYSSLTGKNLSENCIGVCVY